MTLPSAVSRAVDSSLASLATSERADWRMAMFISSDRAMNSWRISSTSTGSNVGLNFTLRSTLRSRFSIPDAAPHHQRNHDFPDIGKNGRTESASEEPTSGLNHLIQSRPGPFPLSARTILGADRG